MEVNLAPKLVTAGVPIATEYLLLFCMQGVEPTGRSVMAVEVIVNSAGQGELTSRPPVSLAAYRILPT